MPLESVRSFAPAAIRRSMRRRSFRPPRTNARRPVKDDARLFAIFLDEYHVGGGANTDRVREALLRFVDRDLTPRDLVAVMKPLDSLFAIRLTRDRAAVRRAIETFEGRKGEYEPRNAYERNYIAGTPARIDAARNQVALSAINALAVHLGSLADRRKTLVVATEGWPRRPPARAGVPADARHGHPLGEPVERRRSIRSTRATAPDDAGGGGAAAVGRRTPTARRSPPMRRPDCGAPPPTRARTTCCRSDAAHPDDGRFRELQVRVKRPGVRARARKGYWARVAGRGAAHGAAGQEQRAEAGRAAGAGAARQHAHPPVVRGVARRRRQVTRDVRLGTGRARARRPRAPPGARDSMLTARSADGTVLFEGPVAPTGPAAIDDPGATPSRAVFDMPPGRLRLRMSIQDAASQVLDQDVREISVRDLRGDVAIGTPQVLRARNAREFRTLDAEAAVPVASREFSRTERLLIRFQAYGPAARRRRCRRKLLGRRGTRCASWRWLPASTPGDNAIDLPLAGLAAGEYMIEVTATSAAGEVKDRVGFRRQRFLTDRIRLSSRITPDQAPAAMRTSRASA